MKDNEDNVVYLEEPCTLTWEIPLFTNSSKYKIDIYTFIGDYASYIFRRRKDDKFICEFDKKNLNITKDIQCPVSAKDFDEAMNRLKEYKKRTAHIDAIFDKFHN